jgi:hypothetical protein
VGSRSGDPFCARLLAKWLRDRLEAEERGREAAQILADRDFFATNYRLIIADLQRERGRLDEEFGKIRQEMAEQPIACDKRISHWKPLLQRCDPKPPQTRP